MNQVSGFRGEVTLAIPQRPCEEEVKQSQVSSRKPAFPSQVESLPALLILENLQGLEEVAVVGLLGHMVVLFLVFEGTSILFSIVAVSIYIPTNSAEGFPFLHALSSIYCL